ncbi:MAG: glycosyltransferase involved in cell wall biosynthesis, partial [Paracoccaceae bacterium]
MNPLPSVSVIIPTYNREEVLVQTLDELLNLAHRADEIIVVDQSERHSAIVQSRLLTLEQEGEIRWIKLSQPSIPNAMNVGTVNAKCELVLFLDDDILIPCELVLEHAKEYTQKSVNAVAGHVIQSWETALGKHEPSFRDAQNQDPDAFRFNSSTRMEINRFSGGNVSFRAKDLMSTGGFDNNFAKVAYRFEAECAERFTRLGKTIVFQPKASVLHLKELSGGTRSFGDHQTTITPSHSVGRYYYFLVVKNQHRRWARFISSPFSACATRFHLKRPWYIPVTLVAEFSGMIWATYLALKGQDLLRP